MVGKTEATAKNAKKTQRGIFGFHIARGLMYLKPFPFPLSPFPFHLSPNRIKTTTIFA
jgi:hypothetical protein